jgi:integrase
MSSITNQIGDEKARPSVGRCQAEVRSTHKERRLDTPRVFLYNGKPWKNPGTAFAAACRGAGIAGLRLHDLRHYAATNLRRAGVDTMTAMKTIGHKSEQMHRQYNTIQSEDLHEAAKSFRGTELTP